MIISQNQQLKVRQFKMYFFSQLQYNNNVKNIRRKLIMSTTNQFVWNFEEGILNKFEELQEDGRFRLYQFKYSFC